MRPVATILPTQSEPVYIDQIRAAMTHYPTDVQCGICTRQLCVAILGSPIALSMTSAVQVHLSFEDYCRWCARPISEKAEEHAPIAGYVAFAKALTAYHRNSSKPPIQTDDGAAA